MNEDYSLPEAVKMPNNGSTTVLDAQIMRKEELLQAIEEALSLIEERIEIFTGIKRSERRKVQDAFLCKLERSNEANLRLEDILDRTNSIRFNLSETL